MSLFNRKKNTGEIPENVANGVGINPTESKKKSKSGKSLTRLILAFAFSILVFVGVISLESYALEDKSTMAVVVAAKDIPSNTIITSANVAEYFTTEQVNTALSFEGCVTDISLIEGQTLVNISSGEIVSASMFKKDYYPASIKDPVEISMKASDLSQAVSGILRTGDKINVSIVSETEDGLVSDVILESTYVTSVYDSSCLLIDPADIESNAAYINIVISKTDEKAVNEALYSGTLRISKIEY